MSAFLDVLQEARHQGNRMSSLPIAEYCGLAPQLAKQHGAGRVAAMGRAFHALCEGKEPPVALTEEEDAEVSLWIKPHSTKLHDGTELFYADAEREAELLLGHDGESVDRLEDALSVGHMDFGWCHLHVESGKRICYVADIKKSAWTSSPDSLQLIAYGHTYCSRKKADGYVCGIYCADSGEWMWENEVTMVGSARWEKRKQRVLFAARNSEHVGSRGSHCETCWSRMHCKEWVLPGWLSTTWLKEVAEGGSLDPHSAGRLKLAISSMEDTLERAKENLKAYAQRGGKLIAPDGSTLSLVEMPGRESVSVAKVREMLGERISEVMTRGKPYKQFASKWKKPSERA